MDEISDQLRAWADAAAPAGAGEPVRAEEAMERSAGVEPPAALGGPGRHRRAWLAAAAVVVALVALGAVVVARSDGDGERVRSDDLGDGTTAPAPADPESTDPDEGPPTSSVPVGDVSFELLHVGTVGPPPEGGTWDDGALVLRAASTSAQLEELWRDVRHLDPARSSTPTQPEVDLDDRVVVSIAVGGETCPRTLEGFDVERGPDGTGRAMVRAQPRLVLPAGADCAATASGDGLQYVVAIDWASVGDRFALFVDGSDLDADPAVEPDRAGPTAVLTLDRARPDAVVIDVELTDSTVAAGSTVPATVRVSNASGQPVEIGYCGEEFAIGLENDEVDQQLAFNDCLQTAAIPPGTSTYEVTVRSSYASCTSMPDPPAGSVVCRSDGSIPPLPAGEYRTRLYPPSGLEGLATPPDPLTVTVTDR